MSGGSYDYLCYKDASDWAAAEPERAQRMADRLAELGYHDAAVETNDLLMECRAIRARLEARLARLQPVWKAVEWLDSGDWGTGDVDDEVRKYRTRPTPPTTGAPAAGRGGEE